MADNNIANFVFRNKFKKVMNHLNENTIRRAFEQFVKNSEYQAISFLWILTYASEKESMLVDAVLKMIGLGLSTIPFEKMQLLKGELRYQYQNIHKDFTEFKCEDEEVRNALENFKRRTDEVTTNVVANVCKEFTTTNSDDGIGKAIFLLKSDEERLYYRGLKMIGFIDGEARYLKPFHKEIGVIVEEMSKNRR